jgi:hypothetical protein
MLTVLEQSVLRGTSAHLATGSVGLFPYAAMTPPSVFRSTSKLVDMVDGGSIHFHRTLSSWSNDNNWIPRLEKPIMDAPFVNRALHVMPVGCLFRVGVGGEIPTPLLNTDEKGFACAKFIRYILS